MTPLPSTHALLLFVAAMLLAAGCAAENQNLLSGKYIFLKHDIRTEGRTISGDCSPVAYASPPPVNFDEEKGTLLTYMSPENSINESLILFYMSGTSESSSERTRISASAYPVYGLPDAFHDNLTINAIFPEGNVTLTYQNNSITLKPKERWSVNSTPYIRNGCPGCDPARCTEEIVITDSVYNAGIFDKQQIRIH
jgi:hypothetical protein